MKKLIILIWSIMSGASVPLFAQVSVVNHSTGTMGLTIPIYTLQEGSLSVPISLYYDGSGVPVEAAASSVGLNWTLMAGPYISRAVRDKPDEGYTKLSNGSLYKSYLHEGYPSSQRGGLFKDFEADIFSLSMDGATLQFVLNKDSLGRVLPTILDDNLDASIEVVKDIPLPMEWTASGYSFDKALHNINSSSGISGFIVTMPDGIRYVFGRTVNEREYIMQREYLEQTKLLTLEYNNTFSSGMACPIKWHLSKIEQPNGLGSYYSIDFEYTRRIKPLVSLAYDKQVGKITDNCAATPALVNVTEQNFVYKCVLSKISGLNTEVVFNAPSVPTPSNISTIIPEYQEDNFNNFVRGDVGAISFSSVIEFSNFFPIIYPFNLNNPFSSIPREESLNNIVIVDKSTQKKIGYYLDHGYFAQYSYVPNPGQTGTRTEYQYGRLNLQGLYTIQFNANNTTELLPGYVFMYNGCTLPSLTSLARDHWGYHNGADLNEINRRLYNVPGATCASAATADLLPKLSYALIGSLASTKAPSGGIEYYEYELHDCTNYASAEGLRQVGGLRIKSIRRVEPVSGDELKTTYSYKLNNSTVSSGFLPICPFYVFQKGVESYINPILYVTLLSRFTNGLPVSYKFVKEQTFGKKSGGVFESNGYTEYEFYSRDVTTNPLQICTSLYDFITNTWVSECNTITENGELCFNSFGFSDIWNFSGFSTLVSLPYYEYIRAMPKSIRSYNAQGVLLSETLYKYSLSRREYSTKQKAGLNLPPYKFDQGQPVPKLAIILVSAAQTVTSYFKSPTLTLISFGLQAIGAIIEFVNDNFWNCVDNYTIQEYYIPVKRVQLTSTIEKQYDATGNMPVEIETQYFYESQKHRQVTKVITMRGDATLVEQQIKYSADYAVPSTSTNAEAKGILNLSERKMIVPIESIMKRFGKVVSGTYYQYHDDTNKKGLLHSIHQLELTQPLTTFSLSSVSGTAIIKSSEYDKKVEVSDYSARALPSVINDTDEPGTTNVVYTANGLLPSQVTYTSGSKSFTKSTQYDIPLFGASRSTSVDNSYNTYVYDALGRVQEVKDHNGHLLKTYNYQYAKPPTTEISDDITFDLWGVAPGSVSTLWLQTLTETGAVPLTLIPSDFQNNVNIRAIVGVEADYVKLALTGSQQRFNQDAQSPFDLSNIPEAVLKLRAGQNYRIEAKAYKNGNLVARKALVFRVN